MEEEKKYTESDLQASHQLGLKVWLTTNAFRIFLFFGLGFVVGFLLCLQMLAQKAVCRA